MALLRPPLHEFDQLTQPLNASELATARALAQLDDDWTVYVQPKLELDQPDFIAVHDLLGVCIIEVCDWSPESRQPQHNDSRFIAARTRSVVVDQLGAEPCVATQETGVVRAAVVLPRCTQEQAVQLLGASEAHGDQQSVEVWGADGLRDQLNRLVRGTGCAHPDPESIERLHAHVIVNQQRSVVSRIRSAAGTRTSCAIAAHAAHLAARDKRVLVLSLEGPVANRLRSLIVDRCAENGTNPIHVTCASFHSLATRIAHDAERLGSEPPVSSRALLERSESMSSAWKLERYDAVLVDEGQDIEAGWWDLLRDHLLTPDGELFLVADPAANPDHHTAAASPGSPGMWQTGGRDSDLGENQAAGNPVHPTATAATDTMQATSTLTLAAEPSDASELPRAIAILMSPSIPLVAPTPHAPMTSVAPPPVD